MKNTALLFFISLLTLGCNSKTSAPHNPNIVFIVVDDLGYNDLGFMGSHFYETPHIDALASKGMIFMQGYSNSAVCSPSRASLLTGKYTASHGITDWIGAKSGTDWRSVKRHTKLIPSTYVHKLPSDFITLPEALKEGGYQTFFAGKWHLGSEADNSLPTNHGFDINKGGYEAGGPYSGGYFSPFSNPFLIDAENEKGISLSTKLANETTRFIEENRDSKFFAFLSFYAVHAPIQTTEEKWNRYRDKVDSLGVNAEGFTMERILPVRKYQDNPVYAGLVEQVDEAVGIVLEKLRELKLEENTIVVFTSDNGGVVSGDNFSTNLAPLRGGKGYQWEGGIRVPYVIYVPWMHHKGVKNNTPVIGADLYPTLLDLAGVKSKDNYPMDGVSLVPLLNGNSIDQRPLFWHYPHYGNQGGEPNSIIREGDWKLIHYWEDGHEELYNLSTDLSEQHNLAEAKLDLVDSLSKQLRNWLDKMNANYPLADPLWNQDSAWLVLDRYKTRLMPRLEQERQDMLKKDWRPNEQWWGSKVTID